MKSTRVSTILLIAIVLEDLLHVFDLSGVFGRLFEDFFPSSGDKLLKHLFFVLQEELKPETLSFFDDLDVHIVVDCVILLLDEFLELPGLVLEVRVPLESINDSFQNQDAPENQTNDYKIEETQLNE